MSTRLPDAKAGTSDASQVEFAAAHREPTPILGESLNIRNFLQIADVTNGTLGPITPRTGQVGEEYRIEYFWGELMYASGNLTGLPNPLHILVGGYTTFLASAEFVIHDLTKNHEASEAPKATGRIKNWFSRNNKKKEVTEFPKVAVTIENRTVRYDKGRDRWVSETFCLFQDGTMAYKMRRLGLVNPPKQ
jgi:hypothetical protein